MLVTFSLAVCLKLAAAATHPLFFDYDCALISKPVVDWNALHFSIEEQLTATNYSVFEILPDLRRLAALGLDRIVPECPLGALYISILHYYEARAEDWHEDIRIYGDLVEELVSKFPAIAVASSRWPVFEALERYQLRNPRQDTLFCDDLGEDVGIIDWRSLRKIANGWASLKRAGIEDSRTEAIELRLSADFQHVLTKRAHQDRAQDECMFGFFFLTASQLVSAANKDTQHLPPFSDIVDHMLEQVAFPIIGGSGWPIFSVLVWLSDLNKGDWCFEGDKKYLRGYLDWDLRRDELSPLTPLPVDGKDDFLEPSWRDRVGQEVESLTNLPLADFLVEVGKRMEHRRATHGLRPILHGALDVVLWALFDSLSDDTDAHSEGFAVKRRGVYLVLVYGAAWGTILGRLARHMWQLGVRWPLVVVAIGDAAASACADVAAENAGKKAESLHVACWRPDTASQVHRFTLTNMLLHLGVDVIYLDMDVFLLQDPTQLILDQANREDAEALFAGHADGDCINIGFFYLRATRNTAVWLSQFIVWYHDHPYEVDQRGLHVFMRLPAKKLAISYLPKNLEHVHAGTLDDVQEFVIGAVGWVGDVSRIVAFHWCSMPIARKAQEIRAMYDAAEASEEYGVPLHVLIAGASWDSEAIVEVASRGGLPEGAAGARSKAKVMAQKQTARITSVGRLWAAIRKARAILEAYRLTEAPVREPCW